MKDIDIYHMQSSFYNDNYKAWKSLAFEVQERLIAQFPNAFPIDKKSNRLQMRIAYSKLARFLTEGNAHLVEGIKKRGLSYHLDHIVPIFLGFKYGIPVNLIASSDNLQVVEASINLEKRALLTEEGKALLIKWGYASKIINKNV